MNRETIENEGRNIALSDLTLVGLNERSIALKYFAKGADWRINSVWHNPCDIAEPGKDCLVEHMDGDGNVCIRIDWRSEYEWVNACHYDKVLRWAYLDDLIPCGKEEEK